MRLAIIAQQENVPLYEQAAARSGRFEIACATSDLTSTNGIDQLLAQRDNFDACVMLAPNSISREQIETLANSGKHILVEANYTDITHLDKISEIWKLAGATCCAAQIRRFTPYATAIREGLDKKQLGEPGLVRIHRWLEKDQVEPPQTVLWAATVGEIDLACSLFDSPLEVVSAQAITGQQGIVIHLGFQSGMAIVDCSIHAGKPFYTASLIGSKGAAYADDHHNTNLLMKSETLGLNVAQDSDSLRLQIESFVDTIKSGSDDTTIDEMKRAIRVSQSAIKSAGSGQAAKFDGDQYELQ